MPVSLAMPGLEVQEAAAHGDMQLAQFCYALFQQARDYRRPMVSIWQECWKALHGKDTWAATRPGGYPAAQLPEIWPIITAMTGWMTDTRPYFEVVPVMEPFGSSEIKTLLDNTAQDLQTVLHANWNVNDTDAEVEKFILDANTYGTGIIKTAWDANLVGGMGDAVLRRVDPFTFYPDPNATNLDNMNFCVEVRQMTLQEVARVFGNEKMNSIINAGYDRSEQAPQKLDHSGLHATTGLNYGPVVDGAAANYGYTNSRLRARSPYDKVTLIECWIRQHQQIRNEETGTWVTFDGWRCVICTDSTVLLDKYATEMFPHGQHPYSRFVLQDEGSDFWGQSLVELLMPIQASINWISAAMEHHMFLTGNPILVHDARSGVRGQTITNVPGQKLGINDGGQVQWLMPPQMDSNLAGQLIQFYKSEMEGISGLSAIVRGFMPSGRNAEGVLESVQESAFVRVRLALRNLERALRHAGEKQAALIVNFYTTPRAVSLIGQSGERTWRTLKANHFYLPGEDGKAPMRYQLAMGVGSMLPTSRQSRANLMIQLFGMGIVDEEAVLEALQIPNWRTICARVREMKAAGLLNPPGARQRAGRTS